MSHGSASSREAMSLYTVIFLDCLSYAMIMPYLPFILMDAGGDARMGGLITTIHAVAAIAAAPILGKLSDRWGRKPVLIVTIIGTALSYIVFAFAPNLAVLAASRAMAGIMAGNAGVVQAGLTDATSEDERGKAMSFSTAAWGLGYLIGPVAGAALTIRDGASANLYVGLLAVGASIASAIFVWRRYPTAERPSQNAPATRRVRDRKVLGAMAVQMLLLLGLLSFAQNGLASMTGFWANASFGWSERGVSLLMFAVAGCIIAVQVLVMPMLFKILPAAKLLILSLLVMIVGCASIWFFRENVPIMGASAALLFCGITAAQSVANTVLSQAAPADERGAVMGLAVSIGAIGRVLGPTTFGFLFVAIGAQSPFIAVFALISTYLGWRAIDTLWGRTRRQSLKTE